MRDIPKAIKAAILPLLLNVEKAITEESIAGKPKPIEKAIHRHRTMGRVDVANKDAGIKGKVSDSIRPERSQRRYPCRICTK